MILATRRRAMRRTTPRRLPFGLVLRSSSARCHSRGRSASMATKSSDLRHLGSFVALPRKVTLPHASQCGPLPVSLGVGLSHADAKQMQLQMHRGNDGLFARDFTSDGNKCADIAHEEAECNSDDACAMQPCRHVLAFLERQALRLRFMSQCSELLRSRGHAWRFRR